MENFPEQKNMTRDDYVIVLGDFGLLWHKNDTYEHWLDWLKKKNFTVLWLDGNHENHAWIHQLPLAKWNGGTIHVVAENILHLMRGQVYTIEDKTFFVCGGAASYDREFRTQYIDWWPQEILSMKEVDTALDSLEAVNHEVDYILTHTCPESIIQPMFHPHNTDFHDFTGKFLDEVYRTTKFKEWYFGHWHEDKTYLNFHCLYNKLVKL